MTTWFAIINIYLLLSTSTLQAQYRAPTSRRHSMLTPTFMSSFPLNNNNYNDEDFYTYDNDVSERNDQELWIDPRKEKTKAPSSMSEYQANEQQIQQFIRLLFERLGLKEPPNVTMNVNDSTGLPSPIFKQLEKHQRLHQYKENNLYQQNTVQNSLKSTAERAVLPGDHIPNHTCRQKLSVKLSIPDRYLNNIDCFQFAKSHNESHNLPTNQNIDALRLYVKRNYFHWSGQQRQQHGQLTPDMFQIYQVFRPTSNETTRKPPPGLTDTISLSIITVKEYSDNWLELTVEATNKSIDRKQVYQQLIMPWYGLAIDYELQSPSSSSMISPLSSWERRYYRRFHSKKQISYLLQSQDIDENSRPSEQQEHLYLLVEYGRKIFPSSSGRRGTRNALKRRPAALCRPTSPCCRRSLKIDLDQGNSALNFIIYPRQFDIGECVGFCGKSGSLLGFPNIKNAQYKNEKHAGYHLIRFHSGLHVNRSGTAVLNQPDQYSTHCCSYSRTGGLEIMYTTRNGGPIIRKFVPDMVVEDCKCGLPATIQHGIGQ